MPKASKVSVTRSTIAIPVHPEQEKYYCCRCTREFSKQKNNFPSVQSPLFHANNGFLPVCKHCVDELYLHYRSVLKDDKQAIRRVCMKFDVYWSEELYEVMLKKDSITPRILVYFNCSNLAKFLGKTYDDTIDEEAAQGLGVNDSFSVVLSPQEDNENEEAIISEPKEIKLDLVPKIDITDEMVAFWGSGLSDTFYAELEQRYRYWAGCSPNDDNIKDVNEKAIIKQICMLEVTINRDSAAGKPIDKSVNALNNLLGSANLKPSQKKESTPETSIIDDTPFGVWIKKIEDTRPISEPSDEFKDVDGIIKYVTVWFLGHLCKMLKINNKYSRLYEEELSRLTVERPEYEGEDEEDILDDIFERARESDLGD